MDYTNYTEPSYLMSADSDENLSTSTSPLNNPVTVRTVEPNRSESESTETRLYGAYRNTDEAVRTLTPISTPDAPLVYPFVDTTNPDAASELNEGVMPSLLPLPDFTTAPGQQGTSRNRTRLNTSNDINNRTNLNNSTNLNNPTNLNNRTNSNNRTNLNNRIDRDLYNPVQNQTTNGLYTPLGDKTAPTRMNTQPSYNGPYIYRNEGDNTSISYPGMSHNLNTLYQQSAPNQPKYQMNSEYNMYLPERSTPYYNLSNMGQEDFNDFEAADKDMEYLRQLYPSICRILMSEIQEECDKLEYEGSCMFDEYPDKVSLDRIIGRIYDRSKNYDEIKAVLPEESSDDVSAYNIFYNPCPRCNLVEDMVRVLFLNEIGNRRRRYRSRRRWFY